jgi:16S rRNA (guanine527-N7)-methyltransferase
VNGPAGRKPGRPGDASRQEQKPRFAPPSRDGRPSLSKSAPRSTTPRPGTANARQVWGHTAPPSRARLEELLDKHGVNLPGAVLDKVWQYHGILRRNNGDLDLTRLIGFETIVQRHYADCLILHKMMKGQWPSPLVDIGTGAGFPGLMIKIASPATEMILSEPRNVRVDYLNDTITELGLKNISVFGHKFTSKSFQTPVRGVITRAFEPIGKTLPRLQYSLQVGGLAMFMKGPGVDEELSAPLPSNYKLVRDERYRIPATTLDRAFVVFERIA